MKKSLVKQLSIVSIALSATLLAATSAQATTSTCKYTVSGSVTAWKYKTDGTKVSTKFSYDKSGSKTYELGDRNYTPPDTSQLITAQKSAFESFVETKRTTYSIASGERRGADGTATLKITGTGCSTSKTFSYSA